MISGDRLGLKFPDICLMGEEKPQKNLTQETCPDRDSNPDPSREGILSSPAPPHRPPRGSTFPAVATKSAGQCPTRIH